VQSNVHTPQRLAGESQAQYIERRKQSQAINDAARRSTLSGPVTPRVKLKGSAGAYGRGLRNWINRKAAAAQANRVGRRMVPA
jgi:hypothetical protein